MTNNVMLPWEEWKIEKLLGRGSFGEVYQVIRDEIGTEMRAAVKIIRIPMDESEMERLEDSGISAQSYLDGLVTDIANEIVLMQTLKGAPNIVGIDDYKIVKSQERIQWTIYIRMELLTDLNRYRRTHPLSYKQVLQLGCDLCNALEICQQKKIIHRDIKPSNIFVSPYGEYKLGDFGISKHTENTQSAFSTRKGTISYMAPEIYRGEKYGYSIDLYSLGIVLYQMANNGRLPFYPSIGQNVLPEDAEQALKKRYMGIPFPDPAYGGKELGDILRKACNIDPKKRYGSPEEMRVDLRKMLNYEEIVRKFENEKTTILSSELETKEKTESFLHKHYNIVILMITGFLGICSAGTLLYINSHGNGKENEMELTETIVTERVSERMTESDTMSEAEMETETEKLLEPLKEMGYITKLVNVSGEKNQVEIWNDTDVDMEQIVMFEEGEILEIALMTSEESQTLQKWSIRTEKDKKYHICIKGKTGWDRLEFYNVSFANVDEVHLCQEDGYTYVTYIKDKKITNKNTEKYRTKTYDKSVLKYVITSSGLNVRTLPDNKNGAVEKKMSLANEIAVYGEAKGLINGKESDWYLIKVEDQYGYISANADYTTDNKKIADQKKADIMASGKSTTQATDGAARSSYSENSDSVEGLSDDVVISSW